jgi:hypothetical protein
MDCAAIYAEVQANNEKVQQLASDQGWKVAQNVAAGVAGFVVPVLWRGVSALTNFEHGLQDRCWWMASPLFPRECPDWLHHGG